MTGKYVQAYFQFPTFGDSHTKNEKDYFFPADEGRRRRGTRTQDESRKKKKRIRREREKNNNCSDLRGKIRSYYY